MKDGPGRHWQTRGLASEIPSKIALTRTQSSLRFCPRHPAGFTLLEMILVLAILALASSLVAPAITSGIKSAKLKTTCRKAGALMRQARNKAVAFKRTMVVDIDGEAQRLAIHPFTGLREDQGRELTAQTVISYPIPQGISIEEMRIGEEKARDEVTQSVIFFYPDGRSTGGQILFQDDRGRALRLLVDRITGGTEIREPLEMDKR